MFKLKLCNHSCFVGAGVPPQDMYHPINAQHPEIASILQGEEEWLQELVSRSEVVQSSSASSSSPPPAVSSESLRMRLDRQFKWGQCAKCRGRSLQPHIMGVSARKAGDLVLYCSNWWRDGPANGRLCWYQEPFPMSRFEELSFVMKRKYADLRLSLARNSRQDGPTSSIS